MYGIEVIEIVTFLKQLGLAITGAASMWGLYFFTKSKQSEKSVKSEALLKTAEKMIIPFSVGFIFVAVSWIILFALLPETASAHEGITIDPTFEEMKKGMKNLFLVFLAWVGISLTGIFSYFYKKQGFKNNIGLFYLVQFVLSSVLITFPAWSGEFSNKQFFLFGHNHHSIFTVGTVVILDFIFLYGAQAKSIFKKYIYPSLVDISKVIWVGLGIEFLSVGLVFNEAIEITPKFMFMQTLIAIIIINGVFLSGPVTQKFLQYTKRGLKKLDPKWAKASTLSGTLSIVSWVSITMVDFLKNLSLSYLQLMSFYVVFLVVIYCFYNVLEHYKIV